MAIVRIIITLRPGVLDAQGQAVQQGLKALGYAAVSDVKVGRYLEIAVPDDATPEEIHQMCERFLANPLIEQWRIEHESAKSPHPSPLPTGERVRVRGARGPRPEARDRGVH